MGDVEGRDTVGLSDGDVEGTEVVGDSDGLELVGE